MDEPFQQVLSELEIKRTEIRCSNTGARFRGHSSPEFSLLPALLRKAQDSDTEHTLYHACYARAHRLLREGTNSWEVLSILQHHGVPTRLLDWTESFAVALFFALADDPPEPTVWVLNPFRLNRAAGFSEQNRIPQVGLDDLPDYYETFARWQPPPRPGWPYSMPIFLQIPWASDRVAAQQGFFTVHPDDRPLEEACPQWVRRVQIPTEAIPGAKRFLELAGVSAYTVFPDLQGLAKFLMVRQSPERVRYRSPPA